MSKKLTPETRSATLSVRAKLRKALAVSDAQWTKADQNRIQTVLNNLDKTLAPAKAAS